jgi:23S rRNA (cytosine1962-C5)-methyltransferase
METYPQIFLDTSKSGTFQGHHPWVLDRSVIDPTAPFEPGTIVDLMHPKGHFIGRGVYNPTSRIRVRLYQWSSGLALDDAWLHNQLAHAVQLRSRWMETHPLLDCVRLVNSEGDGLSGLVIDKFGDYFVIQCSALAMQKWSGTIATWLQTRFQPKAIAIRSDAKTIESEGMIEQDLWIGTVPESPIQVIENDVRLQLDLVHSQKTGYYLDQRSNRLEAARWVRGSMLDVCAYLGGFSLAACRWGKPSHIVAIDSSKRAIEMAQSNATLNGFSQIEFVNDDCFDYLQKLTQSTQRFQTVVLDPPRMASNRNNVSGALRAYHRLNSMALKLLEPGGMLVSCSCSGRVSRDDFFGVVASAAEREKRSLQVIRNLGADFDHPVATNCPESEYLKCLICRAN